MGEDGLRLLRRLFAIKEAESLSDESLAGLLGVSVSSVQKVWRRALDQKKVVRLHGRTRKAIEAFVGATR
jgi:DNA-directed RNA polymerase specialized sigma24 family protein